MRVAQSRLLLSPVSLSVLLPIPAPDPSLFAPFPICHHPAPSATLVCITTLPVISPIMVTDTCQLLAPPTSSVAPPAPPDLLTLTMAPGSYQKVCFRIMPCSSSHVFLASAVLPFPASTTAGGNSETRPTKRALGYLTPSATPGSTVGDVLYRKESKLSARDTVLREGAWSGSGRQNHVGEECADFWEEGQPRLTQVVGTGTGHRGSPWPGGVRLTAWARAASTDCSASPRRSRPLRALGREQARGSGHIRTCPNLTSIPGSASSSLSHCDPLETLSSKPEQPSQPEGTQDITQPH